MNLDQTSAAIITLTASGDIDGAIGLTREWNAHGPDHAAQLPTRVAAMMLDVYAGTLLRQGMTVDPDALITMMRNLTMDLMD